MGGASQPGKSSGHGSVSRRQVKTGCRTCKIRKIKCDEARPACHRCVSTGRVCEGYGIWGGGGNFYGSRQSPQASTMSIAHLQRARVFPCTRTTEEQNNLEWFRYRTSKKIPGASILTLWESLLYSACSSEPAILHAVLSLSSVHRREIYESEYERKARKTLDKQDRFTLLHYSKAIRHLQPPFAIKDKASARAALMTCFVFVCLELLRGHLATAQIHLENGLRLLMELDIPIKEDNGLLLFNPVPDSIDDAIVRAFCRLDLQSKLFRHSYQHPYQILRISEPPLSGRSLRSVNEGWKQVEQLFSSIFHLTDLAHPQILSCDSTIEQSSSLLGYQTKIKAEIAKCFETLEASTNSMEDQDSKGLAYGLLFIYLNMAAIMADTCLHLDDESVFDFHTERFISILNRSIEMWKTGQSEYTLNPLPWPSIHMSRSIVDIGWIAPLYYIALKCRVHRIRLQTIRLIETTSYREGMWDSKIASCVARRVMEIEESDYYTNSEAVDKFSLSSSPDIQDLSLPTAPLLNRICEVRVDLSDGPTDTVLLHYRKVQAAWNETGICTNRSHGI